MIHGSFYDKYIDTFKLEYNDEMVVKFTYNDNRTFRKIGPSPRTSW